MKTNKLISGALALLGFGVVAGLGSGCATRVQKSSAHEPTPATDTTVVRAMYGVPVTEFNPDKPIRERVDREDVAPTE